VSILHGLVMALVLLGLATGTSLAAPAQQEGDNIVRFVPSAYSSHTQAVGAGAIRYVQATGEVAAAFRFRDLTPNNDYVVVSRDGVDQVSTVCGFTTDAAGEGSCTVQLGPGRGLAAQLELRSGSPSGMIILRTL
jgi:hypothetical protein